MLRAQPPHSHSTHKRRRSHLTVSIINFQPHTALRLITLRLLRKSCEVFPGPGKLMASQRPRSAFATSTCYASLALLNNHAIQSLLPLIILVPPVVLARPARECTSLVDLAHALAPSPRLPKPRLAHTSAIISSAKAHSHSRVKLTHSTLAVLPRGLVPSPAERTLCLSCRRGHLEPAHLPQH